MSVALYTQATFARKMYQLALLCKTNNGHKNSKELQVSKLDQRKS